MTRMSEYHSYQRVSGAIKNTTGLNGFIDLGYTFGPATPHIYFGYDRAQNSDAWKIGEDNNTRNMYGVSLVYQVTPNMFLVPEFTIYDYGTKPNDAAKTNLGKEWIGGLQFQFIF